MLSVQGLVIAFIGGVAVTLTISVMWLMYAEYRITKEELKQKSRMKFNEQFMRDVFGNDEDKNI